MRMEKERENLSEEQVWEVLKQHFTQPGGFLDQIERGKDVQIKPGVQADEYQELKDIHLALEVIRQRWTGMEELPKWQICCLWRCVLHLENLVQRSPKKGVSLYILRAKILGWLESLLHDLDQESVSERMVIHDITLHMRNWSSFGASLRFGQIDLTAFEETVQALTVLHRIWKERTIISRFAAWLLFLVPLLNWDASIFSMEQKRQLDDMKQILYTLIEECLCEENRIEKI